MMQQRINSFKYAIHGFKLVWKSEINMRIHIVAAICAALAGFVFKINNIEWIVLILCITLVWSAEIGNTILEKYFDAYHPEIHPTIGALKDMSAAIVLLLAIMSLIVGCIIFIPKLATVLWAS